MIKRIVVDLEKCTGCRRCELTCSLAKEGKFDSKAPRIRVTRFERFGIDIPVACQLPRFCAMECYRVCPVNAITRDVKTGATRVNQSKCIGCQSCVTACPLGAINVDRENRIIVCDLCDGDPACVKRCLPGALKLESTDLTLKRKREESTKPLAEKLIQKWGIPT